MNRNNPLDYDPKLQADSQLQYEWDLAEQRLLQRTLATIIIVLTIMSVVVYKSYQLGQESVQPAQTPGQIYLHEINPERNI